MSERKVLPMLVNINYSGAPGSCYTPGISVTVLGQVNRFTLLPVPFVALSTGGNGGICFVSNFREGRKKRSYSQEKITFQWKVVDL